MHILNTPLRKPIVLVKDFHRPVRLVRLDTGDQSLWKSNKYTYRYDSQKDQLVAVGNFIVCLALPAQGWELQAP